MGGRQSGPWDHPGCVCASATSGKAHGEESWLTINISRLWFAEYISDNALMMHAVGHGLHRLLSERALVLCEILASLGSTRHTPWQQGVKLNRLDLGGVGGDTQSQPPHVGQWLFSLFDTDYLTGSLRRARQQKGSFEAEV